jgi:hypothetical protein
MKRIIVVSYLIIALGIHTQCNKPHKASKNIIVLIDLSSSRDSLIRSWYKSVVKSHIFPNLGRRDRIIVLPVDRNSLTASKEILSIDFSLQKYGNQYNGLNAEEIEQKQHHDSVNAVSARLDTAFAIAIGERNNFQRGTDIFNALSGATRYFIPDAENIVILLCDMQQYSEEMNLEDNLNSEEEVEEYLQNCRQIDLGGAAIIVLTGRTEMSSQKFAVLQSLWTAYFKKGNGQLIDYSSEAVSVLETALRTNQ